LTDRCPKGDGTRKGVTLRDATRADFDGLLDEPLPWRSRAIAGEIDGQLLGVGGIARLPNGTWAAFVHLTPDARRYPVALHKAALLVLEKARRARIPCLVAIAEDGIEPAKRWLHRLGFRPEIVDGKEVWTWHR